MTTTTTTTITTTTRAVYVRIEAESASYCVPGGHYFRVYLNGTDLHATQRRGINIVVFDGTFNVIFRGNYDTFASTSAADALSQKLNSYPVGTVAAIGMADEHTLRLTQKVCESVL
jgi:hypothetical protein